MFKTVPLILALALLTGCAVAMDMGNEPAEGWPQLKVVEHHIQHDLMKARCAKYGTWAMACAEVDFRAARCDIWYSADFPPSPAVQRHERLHCDGFDHEGGSALRDAWLAYRSG